MGILVEDEGAIRTITINRPEVLNALDPESMQHLADALISFRESGHLAVAIITGAGDRAFCTGTDLRRAPTPAAPFAAGYLDSWDRSVQAGTYVRSITLHELGITKPLIAAVNGHAVGGGLEIALGCHVRVASGQATFGLPEARWASVPGAGGVSGLLRALPPAIAMKMLLTGDRIDARTALAHGLVSDVVAPGTLLDFARDIAARIAGNGPLAIRAIIETAARAAELGLSQSIANEHLMWGLLRDTEDRAEGRRAFQEKRPPTYRRS